MPAPYFAPRELSAPSKRLVGEAPRLVIGQHHGSANSVKAEVPRPSRTLPAGDEDTAISAPMV